MFEAEQPILKTLPLAVQQKHIVVTCNYEARRRGLRKLQLIKDAKRICPDVVIVLGEDLTRFRDASKELYRFLKGFVWGDRVEKLGFDEVCGCARRRPTQANNESHGSLVDISRRHGHDSVQCRCAESE